MHIHTIPRTDTVLNNQVRLPLYHLVLSVDHASSRTTQTSDVEEDRDVSSSEPPFASANGDDPEACNGGAADNSLPLVIRPSMSPSNPEKPTPLSPNAAAPIPVSRVYAAHSDPPASYGLNDMFAGAEAPSGMYCAAGDTYLFWRTEGAEQALDV